MTASFNQYHHLRARRLAEVAREFRARGKSVVRCDLCQLADYACICRWLPRLHSASEFVLLMHRNELFKPTNSGRLIADILPDNTHAFCWSRTQPPAELVQLLRDPHRRCMIVFPKDDQSAPSTPLARVPGRVDTFILLDGTWKQARRMLQLSRWLQGVPTIAFPESLVRGYAVRKSEHLHQVSTAEAAGLCLQLVGEDLLADTVFDVFQLFNLHYLATRGCYVPQPAGVHQRLATQCLIPE